MSLEALPSHIIQEVDGRDHFILVHQKESRIRVIKKVMEAPDVYDFDVLKNKHRDEIGYVVCPGPSLNTIDKEFFKDKLVFGVNSTGFVCPTSYWIIDEMCYLSMILRKRAKFIPKHSNRVFVASMLAARAFTRHKRGGRIYNKLYVSRFRAVGRMPLVEGLLCSGTLSAIETARWCGCKKIYIFGLDFGKVNGQTYAKDIPCDKPDYFSEAHEEQLEFFKDIAFENADIVSVNDVDRGLQFPTISIKEFFNGIV